MNHSLALMRQTANDTRYLPGRRTGHCESFFLRANHPSRPLAFWIHYSLFSRDRHPENATGELWAVSFDGETQQHVAINQEIPFAQCDFKTQESLFRSVTLVCNLVS